MLKTVMRKWKDIKGYEGFYQVSNDGQVKSLSREIKYSGRKSVTSKERILKQSIGGHGYYVLNLSINKKISLKCVHTLVCEAFHGERPPGHVTNHKNGIKTDNREENLEWATYKDNLVHAFENNLNNSIGETHKASKLKGTEVTSIKIRLRRGESYCAIARDFGVNKVTIYDIRENKTWKHIPWPNED